MNLLQHIKDSLLHLVFPHICAGCGTDLLQPDKELCWQCIAELPQTNFHMHGNNPIEKIFWGRLPVTYASSQYYFSKASLIQRLLHQFKYKGNKELGYFLGTLMGYQLQQSNRFSFLDGIIPLPLHPSKEKKRGFNQAAVLSEGIAAILQLPVLNTVVVRRRETETQTKKSRVSRWQNMQEGFELVDEKRIAGKHVLLVDDVVTTGATLESCGRELLNVPGLQLSITTLCYSLT